MEYLQVTVTTTTEFSDIVALCLTEQGSDGVQITDVSDVREVLRAHHWDYADETLLSASDPRVYVSGFFSADFCPDDLLAALQSYRETAQVPVGSLETKIRRLQSADWENEWRKYYAPIEIGEVVIVPQWQTRASDGKKEVRLEPGMAFGTGIH